MFNFREFEMYSHEWDVLTEPRVALFAITVGITLIAGKYMKFSATSLGNLIPVGVSKFLLLPALFNGKHQTPLAGSKFSIAQTS